MILKIYNVINDILNSSPLIEMLINSLISIPIGFLSGWGLQCIIDKKVETQRHNLQVNDIINAVRRGEYINLNTYVVKNYSNESISAINQYNDRQQSVLYELKYVFCDLLNFKDEEQYKNIDLYRWQYLNEKDLHLLNKICRLYLMEDFSNKSLYECTEIYAYLCKTVQSSDGFEIMSFMHWIDNSDAKELKNTLEVEKNKVVSLLEKEKS